MANIGSQHIRSNAMTIARNAESVKLEIARTLGGCLFGAALAIALFYGLSM